MRRCVLKTVGDTRQRISVINTQLASFSPLRDTDVGTLTHYVLSTQMLGDNVMFLSFSSRLRRSFPMKNLLTLFLVLLQTPTYDEFTWAQSLPSTDFLFDQPHYCK